MIVYFSSRTHPGYWLRDTDGTWDFGGTNDPNEATKFKTAQGCRAAIMKCAQLWNADIGQFHIFKKV